MKFIIYLSVLATVFTTVSHAKAQGSVEGLKCIAQPFLSSNPTATYPSETVPCSLETLGSVNYPSQHLKECIRVKISDTESVRIEMVIDGTPNRLSTTDSAEIVKSMLNFPESYSLSLIGNHEKYGFFNARGSWFPSRSAEEQNSNEILGKPANRLSVYFTDLQFIIKDLTITCARYIMPN